MMHNLPSLSFCTVTYNNADKIEKLIKNIEVVTKKFTDVEIFIVDNGSEDNTRDIVRKCREYFDNIVLIVPKTNRGFGAGNNEVTHFLASKYHILVNPDVTIASEQELIHMLNYMNKNAEVALLSPKLINTDGTIQRLYKHNPSVLDMALRFVSPNLMRKRQDWFVHNESNYNKIGRIEHASGAFMVFRTEIFKEIGGFDERYFMYLEDADITRKINQKYNAIFYPCASVVHEWQRDSHKRLKYALMTISSMFKYFNKWGWKIW